MENQQYDFVPKMRPILFLRLTVAQGDDDASESQA